MSKDININNENKEIFEMKTEKILEIIFSLCEKKLVDVSTLQSFNEKLKRAETIKDLNEIEFDLIQIKKLEITRRGTISYILDYREEHSLTDVTKKILVKKVYDANTLEELQKVEEEIEKIIKEESSKIDDEYKRLYKQFALEDIEYQEIREIKK